MNMPLRDYRDSAGIQAKQVLRAIQVQKVIQDSVDIQDSAARREKLHHPDIRDIQVKADGQESLAIPVPG